MEIRAAGIFLDPKVLAWTDNSNDSAGSSGTQGCDFIVAAYVTMGGMTLESRLSKEAAWTGVNSTAGKIQGVSMYKLQYMH